MTHTHTRSGRSRRLRLAAVVIVTIAGVSSCGDDTDDAADGMTVLDADATVGDSTLTDLAADYARGISVTPASKSMLVDPALCDMGLSTDEVYFAPAFGAPGPSTTSCSMKAGQALFLSPAGAYCIESGEDLADTACLDEQWNLTTSSVTVNGESIDLTDRLVDTEIEAISLPEDNIYGEPPMDTKLIARVQAVVVEGLPVGEHEVELAADFGNGEFAGSITIALTVEE